MISLTLEILIARNGFCQQKLFSEKNRRNIAGAFHGLLEGSGNMRLSRAPQSYDLLLSLTSLKSLAIQTDATWI